MLDLEKKWMVLKNITGKNDHVLQNKYPRRNHDCLLEKLKKNKYTLSVDASTTNLKNLPSLKKLFEKGSRPSKLISSKDSRLILGKLS